MFILRARQVPAPFLKVEMIIYSWRCHMDPERSQSNPVTIGCKGAQGQFHYLEGEKSGYVLWMPRAWGWHDDHVRTTCIKIFLFWLSLVWGTISLLRKVQGSDQLIWRNRTDEIILCRRPGTPFPELSFWMFLYSLRWHPALCSLTGEERPGWSGKAEFCGSPRVSSENASRQLSASAPTSGLRSEAGWKCIKASRPCRVSGRCQHAN